MYLTNPGCSFDLSRIEDVQISGSMSTTIHKILESARFKIKLLECSARKFYSVSAMNLR
jgi:glutamine amidotransferase PdxT